MASQPTSPMTADQVLSREYLEIRGKILELAASLDRIQRSHGTVQSDRRRQLIAQGLEILSSGASDRAEQIQLLFSRPYSPDWREEFGLTTDC